jgi:molybdopterin biosynthesis enzyme
MTLIAPGVMDNEVTVGRTTMVALSGFPPAAVAMICACPVASAVTSPSVETVAMDGLAEIHAMAWSRGWLSAL